MNEDPLGRQPHSTFVDESGKAMAMSPEGHVYPLPDDTAARLHALEEKLDEVLMYVKTIESTISMGVCGYGGYD